MSSIPAEHDRSVTDLLRQLAAAGPAAETDVQADDFDWQLPCRFRRADVARLNEFGQAAAESISQRLGALLRTEVKAQAATIRQQYAAAVKEELADTTDYCIPLTLGAGRPVGLVLLAPATGRSWVRRVLGDSAEDADREFSTVDRGLMLDIVAALAQGLSDASAQAGGPTFKRAERLTKGEGELPGDDHSDFCRLSFASEGSQEAPDVSLLILSEAVEPIARGGAPEAADRPAEELRKDILGHLEQLLTVVAAARLGAAEVPVRELLCLEPGDVLVTETAVGQPIDLVVQGLRVLSGLPVQSSGKYSLKITADTASSPEAKPEGGP